MELTDRATELDLYLCDTEEQTEAAFATHMGTVEENERLYTKKEVADAEAMRRNWRNLGFPGVSTMRKMIQQGTVRGMPGTVEDLMRGLLIWGRPLEIIRGKTKNRKVRPQRPVHIERTVDKHLVIRVDVMFVKGVAFLIAITKPLLLGMVNHIANRSAPVVYSALKAMLDALWAAGFIVSDIVCDGEGAISKLTGDLQAKGIRVHVAGRGTHVPEAEERVRTYKEGIRGVLSTLKFTLPFFLLMHLVYYVVSRRNMIPHSASADFIPPIQIFRNRPVDWMMDIPLAFGTPVECFIASNNSVDPRTGMGMVLGSEGTESGTHKILMLNTWRVIRSDRWEERPVDAEFIAIMNAKAAAGTTLAPDVEVRMNDVVVESGEGEPPTEVHERQAREPRFAVADYDPTAEPQLMYTGVIEGGADPPEQAIVISNGTGDAIADDVVMADPDIFARAARGEPLPVLANGGVPQLLETEESRGAPEEARSASEESRGVPEGSRDAAEESRGAPPNTLDSDAPATYLAKTEAAHGYNLRPKRASGLQHGRWQERDKDGIALKVSLTRAQERYGEEADRAATAEVTGIHRKGVFEGVHRKSLSTEERKRIIISQLFLKEKFTSTGDFEKLKARLVAGGHMQDKSDYSREETSAPTVALTSVNVVAGVAAFEGRHIMTMDVPQAFLNGDMKRDVLMRIEPALAKLMCKIPDSNYAEFLHSDGSLIVRLKKALYGTLEAAKIWYEVLSNFLLSLGFVQNRKDDCVFNKMVGDVQLTTAIYVDDCKCTCKDEKALTWLADAFNSRFPGMTINRGLVHSFLGQTWDYSAKGKIRVTMEGNIGQMVEDYGKGGSAATPAGEDLFSVDPDSPPLPEDRRARFHSFVQRSAWVAKRIVPQLGPALSFLMPRVYKATEQDEKKLDRVLKYLNVNSKRGIVIEPAATGIYLHAYVDASFAVHPDMKSQTGANISLGKGPVFTSSTKQKLNGTSSTEAELIGVGDSLSQILWVRDFLIEQGHAIGPAVVYQDNQSTMKLAERGSAASQRTRHIAIRFFFVHDRMASGEIAIEYMPTGHMLADILTKPLQGILYRRLRGALTNWYEPGELEELADATN